MEQQSLFERADASPLAARMRPQTLDEFVGQKHLLGPGKVLRRLIESDRVSSMIFWGPPGVGKTSLARVIANHTRAEFINFSAVTSGFLPFVEKGSIILIGATTENPSFEVNGALLSRCKVFVLQSLTEQDLTELLTRALHDSRGFGNIRVNIAPEMLGAIASFANGDARTALSTLEMVVLNGESDNSEDVTVTEETLEQCTSRKSLLYDKKGEEHYNLISALHKSMRNSDPDAAVYWLARMLEAGEDPLYVARRVTRFASEDIGLADPRALQIAVAAYQACHYIGMPECTVHLTEAVVYMSLAPKSNALYKAYEHARTDALSQLAEPVPLVIRNAPTRLMKELHYGEGYQYAHNTEDKLTTIQCLPDSLLGKTYYEPTEQGQEAKFKARLEQIKDWKQRHGG